MMMMIILADALVIPPSPKWPNKCVEWDVKPCQIQIQLSWLSVAAASCYAGEVGDDWWWGWARRFSHLWQ